MDRESTKPEPRLLRGSVIALRRKCGKPTCTCVGGEPHESPALSYSVRGRTRILTLTSADVPIVKAAVDRYRRAVSELEKEALRGLQRFEQRLRSARKSTRGRR